MAIGQIGGLDFRMDFPTTAPAAQPAGQVGVTPVDIEVPEYSDDPIAVRGKLTSDYYNNMGLLRSFAQDMARKGINVFEPDWSQDGGGLAYQTAKKLEAGVLYAANALANEFRLEQLTRPYELSRAVMLKPGVEREGLYYSDPNNFISTAIDPIVTQANERLGDTFYTQSDVNRVNREVRDPRIQYYDELIQKDPSNAEYYNRQKQALLKATRSTYLTGDSGSSSNVDFLALHKDVANHTRGLWTPETFQTTIVGGVPYSANKAYQGRTVGYAQVEKIDGNGNRTIVTVPKKIRQTLRDSEGRVYFQYEDPAIGLDRVDNQPPEAILSAMMQAESAFGGSNSIAKYQNQLQGAGLLNPSTMTTDPKVVFGDPSLMQQSRPPEHLNRIQTLARQDYNNVINGEIETLKVPLENGDVYEFAYDEYDGFHLKNWEKFGLSEEERPKNMNFTMFMGMMDQIGFWDKFLKKQPKKTTSSVPDNLTARQQQAIVDFRIKKGRDPNPYEIGQILKDGQEIDPDI